MPLTADNFVQENSGGVSTGATSVVVTLPVGTTAGNSLIAVVNTGAVINGITLPTGWGFDLSFAHGSTEGFFFARKPNVGAGETSWTFTGGSSVGWAWYVAEVSGLDPNAPVDVSVSADSTTGIAASATVTRSTGTTGANPSLSTVTIAAHACCAGSSTFLVGSFSGQTNGLVEVAESASTAAASVVNKGLSVSRNFYDGTTGPFECTATFTAEGSIGGQHAFGAMVVYRAADSPITTPLQYHTGFEFGTHNGITGSSISTPAIGVSAAGTVGTNIIVQGASARNGSYGLRIVQSGAAAWFGWSAGTGATNQLPGSQGALTAGLNVKPVSGSGVVILAEVLPAVGTIAQLVYDATNSKLGWRWGSGGTVAYQSGTTASGSWAWATARVSGFNTATWKIEWQCEESGVLTAQTGPADLTGQTASSLAQARVGAGSAQTMTADYDDVCLTTQYPVYPLDVHKVLALKVDPAATPTSSGTAGNFALVTSNATGAALTSGTLTTARDSIDELPPTVSASSDGVVQITTAASDYVEFPMGTYTATSTEVIVAVRLLACMISTTGAGAGSLGIRGWDGAAETILVGTGFTWTPGSSTAVSASVPPWVTAQWNPPGGWTQPKLDASALRLGFSTDATPDMGVHAMYLEVAVAPVKVARALEAEGGVFAVDTRYNPNSTAPVSWLVTTPVDRGATFAYTLLGTPTSTYVNPGSSQEVAVSAALYSDVTDTGLYPDPLP